MGKSPQSTNRQVGIIEFRHVRDHVLASRDRDEYFFGFPVDDDEDNDKTHKSNYLRTMTMSRISYKKDNEEDDANTSTWLIMSTIMITIPPITNLTMMMTMMIFSLKFR